MAEAREITGLQLKSTPPAWAGTGVTDQDFTHFMLKSTPPAWAGTVDVTGEPAFNGA